MKIQQFTNEVQEFWYNLISSDIVKDVIDIGTTVVDWVGNIVDALGELGPVITAAIGGLSLNKLLTNFSKDSEKTAIFDDIVDGIKKIFSADNLNSMLDSAANLPSLGDFISNLFNTDDISIDDNPVIETISTIAEEYENWEDAYNDWADTADNLNSMLDSAGEVADTAVTEVNSAAIRDNSAAKTENIAATEGSIVATEADVAAKVADTAATEGATAANGLFAKSLTAIKAAAPYLLAAAAAIAAVVFVIKAVDDAIETAAEANEKFENSKDAYENTKEELESLNSELDETKERIEELNALDKLTLTEKDELQALERKNKELEKQVKLKEKLAETQKQKTADDAYNAVNHSQTVTKKPEYGSSNVVRYDTKVDKVGASVSEYAQLLKEQSELETKLAGMDENADTPWWKEDEYKTVSDKLQKTKEAASELFDSIDTDIDDLREQRDSLFDDDGELIDESYRTTADAIERLILQFSSADGTTSTKELALFDTFHPEQITDEIKEINDGLEITQENLGATEEDFLEMAKEGTLSAESITEKFPNIAIAAQAAGLPLQELVEHFQALNREAEEAAKTSTGGLYSIQNILDDTNSAYNQAVAAQETDNMGATYDAMYEQYKSAKELLEKGDIGTDDFKKIAAMFSPTGAEDAANFKENMSKITRYFTEDNDGVINFLNDLKNLGFAEYNEQTKEWSYSIGNLEEAARKLGIGFEPMMAIFGELNDKGFYNDFFSTTENGTAHLLELQSELQTVQEELQNLYDTDPKNSTAIQAKKDEIEQLKQRIEGTTDSLAELINKDPEERIDERKKKKKELKTAIESYNENYEKLSGSENGRAILEEWQQEIQQYVTENGFNIEVGVDGKLKIVNVEEATEEVEEESKENPVKVTGTTDKYRISHTKTFYAGEDNTTTTLLNKNKAMNLGMTEEDMEKYNQEYLKTGEDSKGLIEKTFYGEDSTANAAKYKRVNQKIFDMYKAGSDVDDEALDKSLEELGRYSFEDLSNIDFKSDDIGEAGKSFKELANWCGIAEDEYEWFIEYLKDNDYIQVDTASAVENLEELQNYLSDGNYEKVVELVGEDNASGVVNLWNSLSANDKFAELSAEDKATMLIETWNEATPEEKEVILKGGDQAEETINAILGRTSDSTTTIELDSGQVVAATEEALGLKNTLEETTEPEYKIDFNSNPIKDAITKAKSLFEYIQSLVAKIWNVKVSTTYTSTGTKPNTSNSNPTVGTVDADGTMHGFSGGTIPAHANGTKVSIQRDESALVNELGENLPR